MLTGRESEQKLLHSLFRSDESEFVALYGRRRVGKTWLVRQTFKGRFAFEHTGKANGNMQAQLAEFRLSLLRAGMLSAPVLHNWQEAFFALEQYLSTLPYGKKVVFIDELPWLDTGRSNFVSALEHFWNGWASARQDIMLVVCGSATSWIIRKIVRNHGGLHNRLTRQIYLAPFTLRECEQYAKQRGLGMNRRSVLETYMVLGGIPYYWSLLQPGLSSAQNIDNLFFSKAGELKNEFSALYASLFRSPQPYIDIVTALGTKKAGMTRDEIAKSIDINLGGKLTDKLEELEQCDFIRSYSPLGKSKRDTMYQLTDNFTLFYFKFMAGGSAKDGHFWSASIGRPQYAAWSGLAFERVCMQHERQIKTALGISGIASSCYSWTYRAQNDYETGVQIDLLIDRSDGVINVCEMKFVKDKFEITAAYDEQLRHKLSVFQDKSHTRKAVSAVMITSYGLVRNSYSYDIPNQLTMDDLFAK